nr:hypothetical protein [Acidisoma sp. L85]
MRVLRIAEEVLLVWLNAQRNEDAVGVIEPSANLERFNDVRIIEPGRSQVVKYGLIDLFGHFRHFDSELYQSPFAGGQDRKMQVQRNAPRADRISECFAKSDGVVNLAKAAPVRC